MREEWKELYQGDKWTYEVSNLGRFRRIGKTKHCYLKPYLRNCIEGNRHNNRKHTLIIKITPNENKKPMEINCKKAIASIFIRELKPNEVVITKNNDPKDIRVSNLFITTTKYLGQLTGGKTKIAKKVIYTDRAGYEFTYSSVRKCAKELGLSYQTILDYCNGKVDKPKKQVRFKIKGE